MNIDREKFERVLGERLGKIGWPRTDSDMVYRMVLEIVRECETPDEADDSDSEQLWDCDSCCPPDCPHCGGPSNPDNWPGQRVCGSCGAPATTTCHCGQPLCPDCEGTDTAGPHGHRKRDG